jgi:endogenous inhibitor of DNA gyrase (YacG/DUF329 family)
MTTARIYQCPTCGKAVKWTPKNAFRPFCSDRCRLIDLGAWADESHRIEGDDLDQASSDELES